MCWDVRFCCCFFFQAEDGIRDIGVTGVQTCALPILHDNRLSSIRNETNKVWNRVYMKGFRIGIKPN